MQASTQEGIWATNTSKEKTKKTQAGKRLSFHESSFPVPVQTLCHGLRLLDLENLEKWGTADVFAESLVFGHLLIHHMQ